MSARTMMTPRAIVFMSCCLGLRPAGCFAFRIGFFGAPLSGGFAPESPLERLYFTGMGRISFAPRSPSDVIIPQSGSLIGADPSPAELPLDPATIFYRGGPIKHRCRSHEKQTPGARPRVY